VGDGLPVAVPASLPHLLQILRLEEYSTTLQQQVQYNVVYRGHTKWQRPLSGVHSIIMEKFSHAGCARVPPFAIFTITYKVAVYTPS
jgi:hypothetical protein